MEEVKRTQEEEQELLAKGKAMRCPNCDGILTNVKKPCPYCGCSDTSLFEKAAKQSGLLTSYEGDIVGRVAGYTKSSTKSSTNEPYATNPDTEKTANEAAGYILVISIIIGAICIISGIVSAAYSVPFIGAGFILIFGIASWTSIKLFVNISRNLKNINDSIQKLHATAEKKE